MRTIVEIRKDLMRAVADKDTIDRALWGIGQSPDISETKNLMAYRAKKRKLIKIIKKDIYLLVKEGHGVSSYAELWPLPVDFLDDNEELIEEAS